MWESPNSRSWKYPWDADPLTKWDNSNYCVFQLLWVAGKRNDSCLYWIHRERFVLEVELPEMFLGLGLQNFLIYAVVSMQSKQKCLGVTKKWVKVCDGTKNWDDIMCPRESLHNLCCCVVWPNYSQRPETQIKTSDQSQSLLPSSFWSFAMAWRTADKQAVRKN